MAGNHLESLVAEWHEFQGYFVRRNIQVGKRPAGGYECELDVVAFHPGLKRLVHIEPSLDASSWAVREQRYAKKFAAGRKYIPALFDGVDVPSEIDQIGLFVYGGGESGRPLSGGRVLFARDFLIEIRSGLVGRRLAKAAVPEEFPLLRTLQFAVEFWDPKATG
ncbi:MAG: hypothetical protein FJ108_16690 [Deltaproteobacteria bacterium]|nr:hypothetical protein [Deltaproteobacteria bacterium]